MTAAFSAAGDNGFSDIGYGLLNNRNRDSIEWRALNSRGLRYYFATKVLGKEIPVPKKRAKSSYDFLLGSEAVREAVKEIGFDYHIAANRAKFSDVVRPVIEKYAEEQFPSNEEAKKFYLYTLYKKKVLAFDGLKNYAIKQKIWIQSIQSCLPFPCFIWESIFFSSPRLQCRVR